LFYDRPVNHPFINYFPVILEYFGDWFRRFLFLIRPATAARQRLCDCTLTSLNLPYRFLPGYHYPPHSLPIKIRIHGYKPGHKLISQAGVLLLITGFHIVHWVT
jgi:hypothetical protein